MKKIFSSILFLFVFTLYAQFPKGTFSKDPILNNENFDKQRVYWGYFLGFNSYDYKFEYKKVAPDILADRTIGFNVGLVGDLRLQEYINLRFEKVNIILEHFVMLFHHFVMA